ncbi:MAG: 30S ribosomal protein S5 [Candidatus Aenigmarchaeota archaeon ex4484_56]|nr:MAG: 30S ribosomal protein S5 [Candidatus Aenigmarchaeota archaeon ex4484_56]
MNEEKENGDQNKILDEIVEESEVEEEIEEVPEKEEIEEKVKEVEEELREEEWQPKTKLGKLVKEGKITLEDIFKEGYKIKEYQLIDYLLPDLEEEIIFVGGTPGKGGGIQRRPIRRTTRVHRSGRRINLSAMVVIGNKNGYLGIGFGKGKTNKEVVKKASKNARLNIFPIKRGCGSWDCGCGEKHSIPYTVTGKCGSVIVKLMPAPRGLNLCVTDENKKLFRLAGIKDIRMVSRGQTGTRLNFIYAIEDALKKMNRFRSLI